MSLEKILSNTPNLSEEGSQYYQWLMSLSPEEKKEYLAKRENEYRDGKTYFCKTCKDSGFVCHPTKDTNDEEFGKVLSCPDCGGRGKNVSHGPDRQKWDLTFEHWFPRKGTEDAFTLSKKWASAEADFNWLLIYGARGSGKTHLAKASQEALRKRNCKVIYIYALNLFDDLRQTIETKSLSDRIKLYQEVQYLIIDDFFLDTKSDWLPAKIGQMLNYRYEFYQPTMLLTKIDPKDLDPDIMSRFNDMERSRKTLITAGDYRPKKTGGSLVH